MKKTALVLAGGGSRGAYEMGVWKALYEMDIPFHIVCGTSIGAINGAMIAQGSFERAQEMWDTVETSQVFAVPVEESDDIKNKIIKTYGTFAKDFINGGTDTSPLKNTLEHYFDEEKIRNSNIAYGLVTLEKESLKPWELFVEEIPTGKLVDYVLASASIYPAVRPHVIDGIEYIDGTYHDNLPVSMALKKGAEKIIAVDLGAFGKVKQDVLNSVEDLTYIKSYWDLGVSLVFDKAHAKKIERYGYLDAMKAFGVFDGYAYTFVKNSIIEIDSAFKKDGHLAKKLGIASGKFRYNISDKFISGKWKKLKTDRSFRREHNISDFLLSIELAAEILGILPDKIYTIKRIDEKIKELVAEIEIPIVGENEKGLNRLKSVINNLGLLDKKVRLKKMALELKRVLETDSNVAFDKIAVLYTEEFFAALYIAIKGLI